jgi:predicted nucleic acid-binding protein
MIYMDTSALFNLVDEHPTRTPKLREWLDGHQDDRLVTSVLAEVELPRALIKLGHPTPVETAEQLLDLLEIIQLGREELVLAARIPDKYLRSMDAIHIASAHRLRPALHTFVTYDLKVAQVMRTEVEVASPGV